MFDEISSSGAIASVEVHIKDKVLGVDVIWVDFAVADGVYDD